MEFIIICNNFFLFYIESIIFLCVMFMMFIAVLMVMEIFLISSFNFWFTNNNESVFNELSHFLSLELSCFRRFAWTWTWWWRFSPLIFLLFLFIFRFKVRFFVIFAIFIISSSISSTLSSFSTSISSVLFTTIFSYICFSWFWILCVSLNLSGWLIICVCWWVLLWVHFLYNNLLYILWSLCSWNWSNCLIMKSYSNIWSQWLNCFLRCLKFLLFFKLF